MANLNLLDYPEVQSAACVPAEDREVYTDDQIIEYRNAVACLYGILELSPRIGHHIMRKIVSIYRSLADIAGIPAE